MMKRTVVIPMKIKNKKLDLFRIEVGCFIIIFLLFGIGIDRLFMSLPCYFYENKYEEYTIENYKNVIMPISSYEQWNSISDGEKKKVLQVCMLIEENYLGISDVDLVFEKMDKNTGGNFNNKKNTIHLNTYYLEDNRKVLTFLTHECRHAYQWNMCQLLKKLNPKERALYAFYETRGYIDEYEGAYVKGEDDYDKYIHQESEIDAYKYSNDAVNEYFKRLGSIKEGECYAYKVEFYKEAN